MKGTRGDPLTIVEAACRDDLAEEEWLERVAAEIAEELDVDGVGITVLRVSLLPRARPSIFIDGTRDGVGTRLSQRIPEMLPGWPHAFSHGYRQPGLDLFSRWITEAQHADLVREVGRSDVELPYLNVIDGDGGCIIFGLLRTRGPSFTPLERTVYRRIAAHIAAGARVVAREERDEPAAIVEPGGRVVHAAEPFAPAERREHLARAVRRIDRARTREGRADPLRALQLWQGLLAGRWAVLERLESDGRRFLVVRKNEPRAPMGERGAALTRRRRQVLFFAEAGLSNKEIAYTLGIRAETVRSHLAAGLAQLGLSRSELVELASRLVHVPPGHHDDSSR